MPFEHSFTSRAAAGFGARRGCSWARTTGPGAKGWVVAWAVGWAARRAAAWAVGSWSLGAWVRLLAAWAPALSQAHSPASSVASSPPLTALAPGTWAAPVPARHALLEKQLEKRHV